VVTATLGDDQNTGSQAIANTVALDGLKGDQFYVNRAGGWMQFQIDYAGSVAGSFLSISVRAAQTGKPGRIAV
jgi:hypothetical protein